MSAVPQGLLIFDFKTTKIGNLVKRCMTPISSECGAERFR